MPGARAAGFLHGVSAERLAEFVLGSFSFTTPVPHHQDIGHDFHCVLHRPTETRRMLAAGPSFSVQVKSVPGPVTYVRDYEIAWINEQQNPFFLCIVDRSELRCDIYSTWNMHNGQLLHGPLKTVLQPGIPGDEITEPTVDDDTIHVPLGPPVLSLTPDAVIDSERALSWARLIEPWIMLDRRNIVRRENGMYLVVGPSRWTTNEPLREWKWLSGFYRNRDNLRGCLANFTLSALALRRVIDLHPDERDVLYNAESLNALDGVLEESQPYVEPAAENLYWDHIAERDRRSGRRNDS